MREVNALIGFWVEAPESSAVDEEALEHHYQRKIQHGCLQVRCMVRVFLFALKHALLAWEARDSVKALDDQLFQGIEVGVMLGLDPNEAYPGVRYAFHTLSHLLIRELALECGYNAASIRERIYGDTKDGQAQAGILIYTAAADSDGTLGGLVDLGKPESLGRLLDQAINRAKICSSDPLCSEHDPKKDRSLHSAACHACTFVSETSCEKGNRYLDRALVVATLDNTDAAFFDEV